jgi:hypothetical protein
MRKYFWKPRRYERFTLTIARLPSATGVGYSRRHDEDLFLPAIWAIRIFNELNGLLFVTALHRARE